MAALISTTSCNFWVDFVLPQTDFYVSSLSNNSTNSSANPLLLLFYRPNTLVVFDQVLGAQWGIRCDNWALASCWLEVDA
jgi:hypothetical protein